MTTEELARIVLAHLNAARSQQPAVIIGARWDAVDREVVLEARNILSSFENDPKLWIKRYRSNQLLTVLELLMPVVFLMRFGEDVHLGGIRVANFHEPALAPGMELHKSRVRPNGQAGRRFYFGGVLHDHPCTACTVGDPIIYCWRANGFWYRSPGVVVDIEQYSVWVTCADRGGVQGPITNQSGMEWVEEHPVYKTGARLVKGEE